MSSENDRNTIPPVSALLGDDEYGKRKALNRLRKQFLEDGAGDEVQLDACTADVDELGLIVLEELKTRPLSGGRKLVVVRDADVFVKKKKDLILAYLDNPASFSRLVLVIRSFGTGRSKVRDRLNKSHACQKFTRPADTVAPWKRGRRAEDTDLNRWVEECARRKGLHLDPGVAAALTHRTGSSLEELDSILERWKMMQEDHEPISLDDVAALGPRYRDSDSFTLVDAVMKRDPTLAMKTLTCLLEEGMMMRGKRIQNVGEMIPLLNAVFLNRLRQTLRAHWLLSSGRSEESLESELRIRSFLVGQILEGVRGFQEQELRFGIHRLLEADRALKFRRQNPKEVLIDLILDLIRGGPAPFPLRI